MNTQARKHYSRCWRPSNLHLIIHKPVVSIGESLVAIPDGGDKGVPAQLALDLGGHIRANDITSFAIVTDDTDLAVSVCISIAAGPGLGNSEKLIQISYISTGNWFSVHQVEKPLERRRVLIRKLMLNPGGNPLVLQLISISITILFCICSSRLGQG